MYVMAVTVSDDTEIFSTKYSVIFIDFFIDTQDISTWLKFIGLNFYKKIQKNILKNKNYKSILNSTLFKVN